MEMESGKLFIGGISWDTSEERLREYFQAFGEIVEAVIMRDRTADRARGFGFIVFANASIAEKVVGERLVIDGRTVETKKAVPREDHQNNRNNGSIEGSPSLARTKIFVGGLASTVTVGDFKRYFDQFRTITDAVVMYDHYTQRPRGFGFITFDSEEAVDKVLFKTFHELNGKMVDTKRAVPKELSPGPVRSQSGGGGFNGFGGLNRSSSFLSAYSPGYGSNSPMRREGRFSPINVGHPPYSPSSYNRHIGQNLVLGFGLNYGTGLDSGFEYGCGLNSSYYSENANRSRGGPFGYDARGISGNEPLLHDMNQSLWNSKGCLNYGSHNVNSNAFVGTRCGNTGSFGCFRNVGEIWGSAPVSRLGGTNIGNGIGDDVFGRSANEYGRQNGGMASSYSVKKNIHDEGIGNLCGGESLYADHGWHSSSPKLEGSFGYNHGAIGDATPNKYIGYVKDYYVNGWTNGGIAA